MNRIPTTPYEAERFLWHAYDRLQTDPEKREARALLLDAIAATQAEQESL